LPPPTATVARATTLPPTNTPAATLTTMPATSDPVFRGDLLVIQVGDYFFEPAYVTVTVGTTVSWHPVGDLFHTVVPKEPLNAFRAGGTTGRGSRDYTWTFTRPGTITYHCDYHPGAMDAILVVVEDL
jgi:plastocyanin